MTIFEQLTAKEGQLKYVSNLLNEGNLNSSDAKEYALLESLYIEEIQELREKVKEAAEYGVIA